MALLTSDLEALQRDLLVVLCGDFNGKHLLGTVELKIRTGKIFSKIRGPTPHSSAGTSSPTHMAKMGTSNVDIAIFKEIH
jgi:hypothetical protein